MCIEGSLLETRYRRTAFVVFKNARYHALDVGAVGVCLCRNCEIEGAHLAGGFQARIKLTFAFTCIEPSEFAAYFGFAGATEPTTAPPSA